jgi:hypothetical protein
MKELTLNSVFEPQAGHLALQRSTELDSTARFQAIKGAIENQGTLGLWQSTRSEISSNVAALLNVSLLDVLRRAWNTSPALARYRDRERYPPDKTLVVPLAEHTIRSRHRPHLEVRVNQQPAGRIDFEVLLEMAIKGLRLHIRDGRIRKIDTGECQAKAKLSCEGFQLVQQAWRRLEMPGSIDLGEGLEI